MLHCELKSVVVGITTRVAGCGNMLREVHMSSREPCATCCCNPVLATWVVIRAITLFNLQCNIVARNLQENVLLLLRLKFTKVTSNYFVRMSNCRIEPELWWYLGLFEGGNVRKMFLVTISGISILSQWVPDQELIKAHTTYHTKMFLWGTPIWKGRGSFRGQIKLAPRPDWSPFGV